MTRTERRFYPLAALLFAGGFVVAGVTAHTDPTPYSDPSPDATAARLSGVTLKTWQKADAFHARAYIDCATAVKAQHKVIQIAAPDFWVTDGKTITVMLHSYPSNTAYVCQWNLTSKTIDWTTKQ